MYGGGIVAVLIVAVGAVLRLLFWREIYALRPTADEPRDYTSEEWASRRARARMRPVVVEELPSASTGQLVQLTGTVAEQDALPLVSPIGGIPCVGYAVRARVV